MTTASNLQQVRYHTPLDVYHYNVDNRPLLDLRRNVERLADATDSAVGATHLSTLAAGFLARGVATENTAIGLVNYTGTMSLEIVRAIITKQTPASVLDTRDIPVIGLKQDLQSFSFTAPSAGLVRPWVIKARIVAATTAIPLYDPALIDLATFNSVGEIEWALVQGTDQAVVPNVTFPSAGTGWIDCIRVVTYEGTAEVLPYLVTYTHFKNEGEFGGSSSGSAFELQKFTHTLTVASDTVSGITVNCNYGIVFVDGMLQPDAVVIDSTTIQFPEVLSVGQTVDVLTTAGGSADPAETVHSRFNFTAIAPGQTVFSDAGMVFSSDRALVFVNGVFIPWTGFSFSVDGHTLTLTTGVSSGSIVSVFEIRAIGIGRPHIAGGSVGDTLVKTGPGDNDYEWGAGSVGASGGDDGYVLAKTGTGPSDIAWNFNAAHGTVRLDYVSGTQTVKLMPEGGGGIYINDVLRIIPTSGVTCAHFTDSGWLSTAVANGFQNALVWLGLTEISGVFYLSPYRAATNTFTRTARGVPSLVGHPEITVVGAARLIAGVNRVLPKKDTTNCLVRSFFGSEAFSSVFTSQLPPSTSQLWQQVGPTVSTEPSGVSWHQPPLSTLQSNIVGSDTLYYQVSGLVLPGEGFEVGISGSWEGVGVGIAKSTVRFNTTGVKFQPDSSGGHVHQPRAVLPSAGLGSFHLIGAGTAVTSLMEVILLPEVDVRAGCTFKTGYYQTSFKAVK